MTPTIRDQMMTRNSTIDYYKMPLENHQIIFVDSMFTYNHLCNRLFENNNEEIIIGFDCKYLENKTKK